VSIVELIVARPAFGERRLERSDRSVELVDRQLEPGERMILLRQEAE
jgi:hypothetical protein